MNVSVTVDPNPFTSELHILLQGEFTANLILRLVNTRGTVVRMVACTLAGGSQRVEINSLQRFAAGMYELNISLLSGEMLKKIKLRKAARSL